MTQKFRYLIFYCGDMSIRGTDDENVAFEVSRDVEYYSVVDTETGEEISDGTLLPIKSFEA